GQGSLALALGFTWLRRDGSTLPHLVFSAAVAGMLLTDLSAARLVRSVLAPLLPPEGTADAAREAGATHDEVVRIDPIVPITGGGLASGGLADERPTGG